MKIEKEPSVSELLQEGMKQQIKTEMIQSLHEEWAKENGYRENDTLNSKNTTCFKDGP
tara:strand:- start:448 stop:621 length:174 start_codon:yes stop_codon:yes gene_type:complete